MLFDHKLWSASACSKVKITFRYWTENFSQGPLIYWLTPINKEFSLHTVFHLLSLHQNGNKIQEQIEYIFFFFFCGNNCNHPSWLSLEHFWSVDLRTQFANFTLSTRLEANVAHLHHGLSELHIEGIWPKQALNKTSGGGVSP